MSAVWSSPCNYMGIQHIPTTAYCSMGNWMVEQFHRQLKSSLCIRLCGPDWVIHLPWILLRLRAAPKEDSSLSSAEMVYGTALTLPRQPVAAQEPPAEEFIESLPAALSHFSPHQLGSFQSGNGASGAVDSTVCVCLMGKFRSGVGAVVWQFFCCWESQHKIFKVNMGSWTEWTTVDHLKLHLSAAFPKRGGPFWILWWALPQSKGSSLTMDSHVSAVTRWRKSINQWEEKEV
jgi:hypothetical protein